MAQIDLIGVGAPIVDSIAQIPDEFLSQIEGGKGGMVLIDAPTMNGILGKLPAAPVEASGGSAGNTIQSATKLGLKTSFLGKLGNDEVADFYRENFRRVGVDVNRFKSAALPNGRCLSLVTPDSQRTMRTNLGASLTLSPADVGAQDFADCRHAHLEGYLLFNQELAKHLLECAKQAGCSVSLDLGAHEVVTANRELLPELLKKYVKLLIANEDEAAVLTGIDKNDTEGTAAALGKYCEIAVLNLGKNGSLITANGKLHRIPVNLAEKPLDTTGAGDSWLAGFLYGWLNGKPLDVCGRYGAILGAEVVQQIGANIPEPRWEIIRQRVAALG